MYVLPVWWNMLCVKYILFMWIYANINLIIYNGVWIKDDISIQYTYLLKNIWLNKQENNPYHKEMCIVKRRKLMENWIQHWLVWQKCWGKRRLAKIKKRWKRLEKYVDFIISQIIVWEMLYFHHLQKDVMENQHKLSGTVMY